MLEVMLRDCVLERDMAEGDAAEVGGVASYCVMAIAGPCRFRRAALSFIVFTSHDAGRATVPLVALIKHSLSSRVSQKRAESAAKAEIDAKAITEK